MFTQFTVVYDSSVLYPAPLRSLLMYLAMTGLFRAKWTNQIHDEWISNLRLDRPDISLTKLIRVRKLMDKHVQEALVEGYEHLIEDLALPDPNDRHVLAAAIECKASLIVTWNTRDFPEKSLTEYGLQVINPDDFIMDQLDLNSELVLEAVKLQKDSYRNPAYTWDEFLTILENQKLIQAASAIRDLLNKTKSVVHQK